MEEEVDLKELIMYFWSKKIIIILTILIAVIVGWGYTKFCVTPIYTSSTSLVLTRTEFDTEADVSAYSKLVDRYTLVASSRIIAEKVKENLKLDMSVDEIKRSIVVTSSPAAYTIIISVTNTDSELIVKIANEVAKIVIEEISQIYNDNDIRVIDCAIKSTIPDNINYKKNIICFTCVGVVLICGYFLLVYMFTNASNKIKKKN